MRYRRKMSKKRSKRNFKKGAGRHKMNRSRMSKRGGTRL